jgi:hypothetical protein
MMNVFAQSLKLMWQGMLAIFVVITLIYVVLSLFPLIFRNDR